jgi:RES domain-containing protein
VLVRLELPDTASFEEPAIAELPPDWNAIPPSPSSMRFGTRWAEENRSLVLYVPSVLAPEEQNAVVNPGHREFAAVKMAIERDFHWDPRPFAPRAASRV